MAKGEVRAPHGRRGRLRAAGAGLIAIIALGLIVSGASTSARLVASDPDAAAADPRLLEIGSHRGRGVFLAHCARCHGPAGQGDRRLGAPDLTDKDWLYGAGTASDIETTITYGVRSGHPKGWNLAVMPAYAAPKPDPKGALSPLSPRALQDLVEYLTALEGRAHDKAAADRGERLYHGQAGCYDCHGQDARGDPAIGAPNLADGVVLYGDGGRRDLTITLERGRRGTCPAFALTLSPTDIRAVALYVFTLSHPRAGGPRS